MSLLDHPETQVLLADAEQTPEAVRGCEDRLAAFLGRYLPRFRRLEQRANATLVIRGLLGGLQRKTCEPIAVEAGVHRKSIQFLVGTGRWDDEAAMLKELAVKTRLRKASWSEGTKGKLSGRFAWLPAWPGGGWATGDCAGAGPAWLLIEEQADGKFKYAFSNLPVRTSRIRAVRLWKSRWPVEQGYQQMKEELGLAVTSLRIFTPGRLSDLGPKPWRSSRHRIRREQIRSRADPVIDEGSDAPWVVPALVVMRPGHGDGDLFNAGRRLRRN